MRYHSSDHPPPPPPLFCLFYLDPHVYNIKDRKPDGEENIFIGRPSYFQNRYRVLEYGRGRAIALFEIELIKSGKIHEIEILRNKNLICFCSPECCHGDVIAKYLYK